MREKNQNWEMCFCLHYMAGFFQLTHQMSSKRGLLHKGELKSILENVPNMLGVKKKCRDNWSATHHIPWNWNLEHSSLREFTRNSELMRCPWMDHARPTRWGTPCRGLTAPSAVGGEPLSRKRPMSQRWQTVIFLGMTFRTSLSVPPLLSKIK